jgi:redox-sensitive bicupin YhaK (pirin superfamily)
MTAPGYQEFAAGEIPVEQRDGARVKIIAGTSGGGVTGPVRAPHVDAVYFDIELAPGARFAEGLPQGHEAFFALYEGDASIDGQKLAALSLVTLGPGELAELTAGDKGARALLLAARPLGEPVAWSGPFVMNTREELMQAYEDYRQGKF